MLPLPDLHVALGAYGLPKSGNGHRARAFEVVIQRHDAMVIANAIHAQVANAIDVSDSFGGVQEDDINAYRVSRLADLLRHDDFGGSKAALAGLQPRADERRPELVRRARCWLCQRRRLRGVAWLDE